MLSWKRFLLRSPMMSWIHLSTGQVFLRRKGNAVRGAAKQIAVIFLHAELIRTESRLSHSIPTWARNRQYQEHAAPEMCSSADAPCHACSARIFLFPIFTMELFIRRKPSAKRSAVFCRTAFTISTLPRLIIISSPCSRLSA